jgi:CHASE3 domain sensor protein
MTSDQRKAEIARLVGQSISAGTLSQPDSDRLAALVAAETGTTTDQAKTHIQQVEQQAKEEIQKAKATAQQAADAAAHATSVAAFWIFGSLLLGAIVAVLAASGGTRVSHLYRDRS